MTHYLRKNGRTIIDIETEKKDIHCVVAIREYSKLLHSTDSMEIVEDFHKVQEIRGEFWEAYNGEIDPDFLARKLLINLAEKYNLDYVTD